MNTQGSLRQLELAINRLFKNSVIEIGSACLTLFFIGLLNMVNIVEDPFGEDLDDLNPDSLLLT